MALSFPEPQMIGQFRTFGVLGPTYRILEPIRQIEDGEWLLCIEICDTGEKTEYPYAQVLKDPEIH